MLLQLSRRDESDAGWLIEKAHLNGNVAIRVSDKY